MSVSKLITWDKIVKSIPSSKREIRHYRQCFKALEEPLLSQNIATIGAVRIYLATQKVSTKRFL